MLRNFSHHLYVFYRGVRKNS